MLLVLLLLGFVGVNSLDHPEDLVNLLAGTFTDGQSFSTGNTLPLVGYPWGFNHWSPQTGEHGRAGSWWFKGSDHSFTWMRCTHQPSPWIGDWGWFLFGPQMGNGNGARNPTQFWEPRGAIIKPHLFDATIAPQGIRMKLAPTMHGASFEVTYPESDLDKMMCMADAEWTGNGDDWVTGVSRKVSKDRMMVTGFGMFIRIESDTKPNRVSQQGDMRCFHYGSQATVVRIRLVTSMISSDQATTSMKKQVPRTQTHADIEATAREKWNSMLKRVDVVDPGEYSEENNKHMSVFYTSLARALAFPRRIDEVDEHDNVVHYSPYDPNGGRSFSGPLVTDNGFWDTFRTVYPMLSLLYPDHLGDIVQGWLNAYKEGGWLPSWASPGYRNCMVGAFGDVVVADAIMREIPGFDMQLAYGAMHKSSFEAPPGHAGGAVGKEGLQDYIAFGYIPGPDPARGGDHVSRTLDFSFSDFAIANAFQKLSAYPEFSSKKSQLLKDAETLSKRASRATSSLYDNGSGLMRSKDRNGHMSNRFQATEWGNGYTEGNAWHHSFPPYDLPTLAKLHGGVPQLLKTLHHMLTIPSGFMAGSYGREIHEMTEMRALAMGQYGHNNQPCHHILYLFAELGERATTELKVREVLDRAYGRDFYAGDEDNGEQGAWFVLSALGLFSTSPGSEKWVIGSPLFKHVRIENHRHLGHGGGADSHGTREVLAPALDLVALGTSSESIHVGSVYVNGQEQLQGGKNNVIMDSTLWKGGLVQFIMKDEADQSPITDIHMLESNPDHKPNHHHHRTDRDHHEHHRTTRTLPPVPVLVPDHAPVVGTGMGVGGVTSSHEDHHRIEEQQKATILALQNQLTTVQENAEDLEADLREMETEMHQLQDKHGRSGSGVKSSLDLHTTVPMLYAFTRLVTFVSPSSIVSVVCSIGLCVLVFGIIAATVYVWMCMITCVSDVFDASYGRRKSTSSWGNFTRYFRPASAFKGKEESYSV